MTGDLKIPAGPGLPAGATIPEAELRERFSRSTGPGGQSVNTTASRVELVFAPATSAAFSEPERRRLAGRLAARLVGGELVIAAQEHRSQLRNRAAARERLVALLRAALAPAPPPRHPTRPTRAAKRRRVQAKKHRGQIKELRGRVRDD